MMSTSKVARFVDDVNEYNPLKPIPVFPPIDETACCEALEVHIAETIVATDGKRTGRQSIGVFLKVFCQSFHPFSRLKYNASKHQKYKARTAIDLLS